MKLSEIREQLDKLDKCLDFIILLRTSLTILVGKVKSEQNLPIYYPDREQKIYDARESFSEKTGVNIEVLSRIYSLLISESVRIEKT